MSLEIKRLKLELHRVQTARHELEFKVEERLEDIRRIEENIQVQKNKEAEISSKINELEK